MPGRVPPVGEGGHGVGERPAVHHGLPVGRGLRLGLGLGIAAYLGVVALTAAGDTLAAYPLMHPDSYDWLVNALRYTGLLVDSTWRAVAGPFVYAVLFALRLENLIPFLGLAGVLATAVMLLTLGWRAAGAAGPWAAALLAANHLVLGHALSVQADVWSAGYGITGLLAFGLALEARRPAWLYLATTALMLGFLSQPSTPFLVPALALMALYDPEARHGVGARSLRWLLWTPHAWGALAVSLAILVGSFWLRGVLSGMPWWVSGVNFRDVMALDLAPALVTFYAWASIADWSIPVALLALLGAVHGLGRPASRRLTLGLLAAVAGNLAVFACVYTGYRENRFVLYWTMPVMLLAGLGLASLRLPLALAVGAVAIIATNLTAVQDARPGTEPVMVLWTDRVLEARYGTIEHPWSVAPVASPARGFRSVLAHWLAARRAELARLELDDVFYARERELIGQLAGLHVDPADTLFLHFAPDAIVTHTYMLRNQFTLSARRRTEVVALDDAADRARAAGVVLLAQSELDRLRAAGVVPATAPVLEARGRWVLVRLGGAQAATPASSRKMSSIERVSSQPGKSAFSRRRSLM